MASGIKTRPVSAQRDHVVLSRTRSQTEVAFKTPTAQPDKPTGGVSKGLE